MFGMASAFPELPSTFTLCENDTRHSNTGSQHDNMLHVINFGAHKSLHEQKQ